MSKSESKAFKGPVAKTENQRRFLQAVHEHDITICQGSVGVGKSFLTTGLACEYLMKNKVSKILFARSSINLIKEYGFNVGSWEEKSIAMFDQVVCYFQQFLGEGQFKRLWQDKTIEFTSTSIIRGRSLKDCFVCVDEAQTLSREDWILTMGRLDRESKIVYLGDRWQDNAPNGFFGKLFDHLEDEAIAKIELTEEDCQRNKHIARVCRKIREI